MRPPERTLAAARRRVFCARVLDRALWGIALGAGPGALLARVLGGASVPVWAGAALGACASAVLAISRVRRPFAAGAALQLDLAIGAARGNGAARWTTWVETSRIGAPFAEQLRARLAALPLPAPLSQLVPLRPSRAALAAAAGACVLGVALLLGAPAPGTSPRRAARTRLARVVASVRTDAALAPLAQRVARLLAGRPAPDAVARVLEAVRARRREAARPSHAASAAGRAPRPAGRPRVGELARLEAALAAWLRARGADAASDAPGPERLARSSGPVRRGGGRTAQSPSARPGTSERGAGEHPAAGSRPAPSASAAESTSTAPAPAGVASESPLPPALARVVARYFEEVQR